MGGESSGHPEGAAAGLPGGGVGYMVLLVMFKTSVDRSPPRHDAPPAGYSHQASAYRHVVNDMKPLGRVVAVVLRRDARWLICQRPGAKRYGGMWEFPGGKLHDGETLAAAAARELREELGLNVSNVNEAPLFSHLDDGSGYLIEFVAASAEGEPELHEHTVTRRSFSSMMRQRERPINVGRCGSVPFLAIVHTLSALRRCVLLL